MSDLPSSQGLGGRYILRRLMDYAWPYRGRTALALLTFAATGVTVLSIGSSVRALIDRGVHHGQGALTHVVAGLLALIVAYAAAAFGRSYLSATMAERMATDVLRRTFDRALAQTPAFFEHRGGANRIWSQVAADKVALQGVLAAVFTTTRNILIVVGGLAAMLTTSVVLTLGTCVATPAITIALRWAGRRIRVLSDAAQTVTTLSNAYGLESIGAIGTVKVFCREQLASDQFRRLTADVLQANNRLYVAQARVTAASILMIFGAAVMLAWISGAQVSSGRLSEGSATAFLFYALVVAGAATGLINGWAQTERGLGAAARIIALIDHPPEIDAPPSPALLPSPTVGEISFEDVSFAYPSRPGQPVLQDFSWRVRPGAVLALVGPSGAGKSTLFHLIVRFYDPDRGCVRLDGVDLRRLDPAVLRSRIGLVPQDPVLLDGTILDNIRYGRPDASPSDIARAAGAAHVSEFADRLPQRLNTSVGGHGVQLSGGQRQRIAIARVILRDPAILLFDEATNALDAESEHLVQTALQDFARGRTTLVIAHRLATVRRADCILVLKQGRIVGHGVHDDLVQNNDDYGRWASLQHLVRPSPSS